MDLENGNIMNDGENNGISEEEISIKVSMALENTLAVFSKEIVNKLPEIISGEISMNPDNLTDEDKQIEAVAEIMSANITESVLVEDIDKFENLNLFDDLTDSIQNVADMIEFNEKFETEMLMENNFIIKMAKRASEIVNNYDDLNSVMIERAPMKKEMNIERNE